MTAPTLPPPDGDSSDRFEALIGCEVENAGWCNGVPFLWLRADDGRAAQIRFLPHGRAEVRFFDNRAGDHAEISLERWTR